MSDRPTHVLPWVQHIDAEIHEAYGTRPLRVGDVVKHPDDGRTVQIVGGRYWGDFGISNFWDWQEVLPDGSLAQQKECGYGWCVPVEP